MAEFEIRDAKGDWLRSEFQAGISPDDEAACLRLLAEQVESQRLRGGVAKYYIRAFSRRRGWQTYRP